MRILSSCPFPQISDVHSPPIDGTLYGVPERCRDRFGPKCTMHYKQVETELGFKTCPCGLVSLGQRTESEIGIVTALHVPGLVDKDRMKGRFRNDIIPRIPKPLLIESLQSLKARDEEEACAKMSKELLGDTLHEMREHNKQLKCKADGLLFEIGRRIQDRYDKATLVEMVTNIINTGQLISTTLNFYDNELNPELLNAEQNLETVGIYKKFEKAMHCLDSKAQDRHVRVKLEGRSVGTRRVWSTFDLVPHVLLDNAIKYSPKDEVVYVKFDESGSAVMVVVESLGPVLPSWEHDRLGKKFFRGSNSRGTPGSGRGLALAKGIVEALGFSFAVEPGQEVVKSVGGVKYSRFRVLLGF